MGILVALTTGLVFWVAAWSFGMKSFDAFMVTALLVMIAVTARLTRPFVERLLGQDTTPS